MIKQTHNHKTTMGFSTFLRKTRNFGGALQKGIGRFSTAISKGIGVAQGALDGISRADPALVNNPIGNAVKGVLNVAQSGAHLGQAIGTAHSINDVVPAINNFGNSVSQNAGTIATGAAAAGLML